MTKVKHVSVGEDGAVWCADVQNRLWFRTQPGMGTGLAPWLQSATAIAHLVSVGSDRVSPDVPEQVWCVNDQGEAFQLHRPDTWQKDTLAKHVKTL